MLKSLLFILAFLFAVLYATPYRTQLQPRLEQAKAWAMDQWNKRQAEKENSETVPSPAEPPREAPVPAEQPKASPAPAKKPQPKTPDREQEASISISKVENGFIFYSVTCPSCGKNDNQTKQTRSPLAGQTKTDRFRCPYCGKTQKIVIPNPAAYSP